MDIEKYLLIHHAKGVGPASFQKLLKKFETVEAILSANARELVTAGVSQKIAHAVQQAEASDITADLEWAQDDNHHIVCFGDAHYPERLTVLPDAPPVLFVKGNVSLLKDPQLAIVGARGATPSGKNIAYELAQGLARTGLLVSSGMAQGIDAFAHLGALDIEAPSLAVIATGQDIVYPAKNRDLAHRLAEHGVIVSEFSHGTPPAATHFPRRNRIISALSLGVLVVEAKVKSGALITARLANEQGREVFAVPGSIKNSLSKGCHYLLRDGATLVEEVNDILREIQFTIDEEHLAPAPRQEQGQAEQAAGKLNDAHFKLLDAMGFDPVTSDELSQRTKTPISEVASMLLMLELENYVSSSGGMYCRIQ